MKFTNPTREQFKAVYGLPGDQPVGVLNLLRFKDRAVYDAAGPDAPVDSISGREAYELYSALAEVAFRRAGGTQLWIGAPEAMVIGPTDESWDLAFVAFYPTVQAFVDLVKSEDYQRAAMHRTAALSDSRLMVCTPLKAGPSFAPLNYPPRR